MIKHLEETNVYEEKPEGFCHLIEVAATYVNLDGKLLLLELSHKKTEAGSWGVPAGKIEKNEAPLNGAKRELFEETGIDIPEDQFKSLGALFIRKPTIDYIYHLFSVQLEVIPSVILSEEHISHRWVSRESAEDLPLMNGALPALEFYYRKIIS